MAYLLGKLFQEVERGALLPLPLERFPFFHEKQRIVHRDGHVEVAKAYYSVPPEYLGHTLWVRWDLRLVRIFNGRMEQIAVHVRQEPGRFSTQDQHIAAEKRSGVERGAVWLLSRVRLIGEHATRWAENMLKTRGIEGVRVLQGLLSLAGRHDAAAIERACEVAFSHGAYRLRTIRELLKREAPRRDRHDHRPQLSAPQPGQPRRGAAGQWPRIQGGKTVTQGLRGSPFCGVVGTLSTPQNTVTLPSMNLTGWF